MDKTPKKIPKKSPKKSPKKILLSVFLAALAVLLIAFPETAENAAKSSLEAALGTVVPSLFSFMVLSDIIVSSDIIGGKGRLAASAAKLFNISRKGAAVFLLGNLCGFPVGAKLAARECAAGNITKDEAWRLTVISNNVSTAFAVSVVGGTLFSSRALGTAMYVCQFAASVITGAVIGIAGNKKIPKKSDATRGRPSRAEKVGAGGEKLKSEKPETGGVFVKAVNDAAVSCIGIASFIVVFGVISSYAREILEGFLKISPTVTALCGAFLEISNGCIMASKLSYPASVLICAFAVGFSGISVLCQGSLFLSRERIPLFPIFLAKTAEGILSAALTFSAVKLFNISVPASSFEKNSIITSSSLFSLLAAAIIFVYILLRVKKRLSKKYFSFGTFGA